jgi:hypothetical protein
MPAPRAVALSLLLLLTTACQPVLDPAAGDSRSLAPAANSPPAIRWHEFDDSPRTILLVVDPHADDPVTRSALQRAAMMARGYKDRARIGVPDFNDTMMVTEVIRNGTGKWPEWQFFSGRRYMTAMPGDTSEYDLLQKLDRMHFEP